MGALARNDAPAGNAEQLEEHGQYLTFTLGGEMYALGILNIKEIIEYGAITAVQMMPAFVRGVTNVRGAVVPVIDLQARFARKPSAVTKRTCIVSVEIEAGGERHDIGVVVDAVNEVLEIPASEIEPAPVFGAKIRADFIEGMGKVGGKFVIILNVARVLSIEEIAALAQAGPGAPEAAAQG